MDAPVVEVFMGDDPLDALVVRVGGRLRHGQDEGGVEDVQALEFGVMIGVVDKCHVPTHGDRVGRVGGVS